MSSQNRPSSGISYSPPITSNTPNEVSRRHFVQQLVGLAAGSQFLGLVSTRAHADQLPMQKNLMLIITDQERRPMWFPAGWEDANLPATKRLKQHGLTFTRAFTATAMCTPARNTMFTGLFPAQHRSTDTLTEDFAQSEEEHQLDPTLPNLATCLKEAGYDVIYKGKWHLTKKVVGADGRAIEDDISRYGFDGWDAPDAGGDASIVNFGGGAANHDERFLTDAIAFLKEKAEQPAGKPFCLVVSLINPHDVLGYPGRYLEGGYTDDPWLNPTTPPIEIPPTNGEDLLLNKKPTAQAQLAVVLQGSLGPIITPQQKVNYLHFYGNLMRHVDGQIARLLQVFDEAGEQGAALLRDTLIIRTSDHGEMGLSHGGLRQKTFVTYEETLNVPLIWSNPEFYPVPKTTDALVSHVDLLPTICSLTGVPNWQAKGFRGVDYSSIILNPDAPGVQDYVLFTFDDIYAAGDAATFPNGIASPPNRIQAIRTADFKYARYYDGAGEAPDQEEFYDLRPNGGDYDATYEQPLEMKNLSEWAAEKFAPPHHPITPEQEAARAKLKSDLAAAVATRLQPRTSTNPAPPDNLQVNIVRWTDSNNVPQAKVEVSFISRYGLEYQIQKSTDLLEWQDVGSRLTGTNGLILETLEVEEEHAYYRLNYGPPSSAH